MTRWETLEEYLKRLDVGQQFTSQNYAAVEEIPGWRASQDIQDYLSAQRSSNSRTLFVLKRQPGTRTSGAVWSIGARTSDVQALGQGFYSDAHRTFERATAPTLRRIAAINPRAAKRAEALIDSVVGGALVVLEAAVNGLGEES